MLQYLIILLDDTSTSYCHYDNPKQERKLMPLDTLKSGILFALKENLSIQFVYPNYELPQNYKDEIGKVSHSKIQPITCVDADAALVVFNHWHEFAKHSFLSEKTYVLRLEKECFFKHNHYIQAALKNINRLNIVITDIETFNKENIENYQNVLESFAHEIAHLYTSGHTVQLNLLTDRLFLEKMNNCNAGYESLTLAPDGRFYICPAFYLWGENGQQAGDLQTVCVKNPQLYRLEYAPICRQCDAYQCRRCVWLNKQTTLEVNTPSHEQCVVAHIERNASRLLQELLRKQGITYFRTIIKELDYKDPFELIVNK